MTSTETAGQWAHADGVAEEAAREVFHRVGARVHRDTIEPSRALYRLTSDGTTVVWGADDAHEGDAEPCVTWTVYDADGDDLLAATVHTDSECGGTAEDLAGRVEVAVRRAVGL
jgi:hypothetical protein